MSRQTITTQPSVPPGSEPESCRTPQLAAPKPQAKAGDALRTPELLAPAGDWECAKAAVENGADAIYFGLERFNARMRAHNFTEADLPKLLEFLHRRGVKGYLTFNTLIFENEMAEAEQYLRTMITAGVDAAIVQDVGACRLIRQLSPDFPIHVSTQMTITSAGGMEFARQLGCNLVVLARECPLKEIEKILASEASAGPRPLPLEVFIHGALCVAYSGQCLTSEALGGRSANRGECAQACRMPYDLIADGQPVPLGDRKYLLSPQDLAGLELVPELARLGVASLKIEGRLKSAEYVANITRIYRQALDQAAGARPSSDVTAPVVGRSVPERRDSCGGPNSGGLTTPDGGPGRTALPEQSSPTTLHAPRSTLYELEMAFSRGLYTGWFRGINNQALVHAHFGKKRGVYLGHVLEVRHEAVLAALEGPLKPGDGIVFDAGKPEEKEEGGRVYQFQISNLKLQKKTAPPQAQVVELRFGHGDIDFNRVHVGDKLWKTSDPELERRLRQSYEGAAPKFERPLAFEVHGALGRPLTVFARDEGGHIARADSAMPLVQAEKQPLTTGRLREQFGRLGGTGFKLGEFQNLVSGQVLVPLSELNRLRREVVEELQRQRSQPLRWTLSGEGSRVEGRRKKTGARSAQPPSSEQDFHLIVLVRNLAQLDAALKAQVQTLYCDFEDPKKYREAVAAFRHSTLDPRPSSIFVAPPRIFKMGEEWILKQVRSCEADGYLVRNYDHLNFFANDRRVGDYSLNVANRLTAEYFKTRFGLERVTASYDLNFTQLEALLQAAPPEWFEVTLHQHIPMFHMEHCVFCAFLSQGTDFTNCGRPCDRHDLKLRDRVGAEHPVKADVGCRNTVFNALAQTGADYAARMLALGVRHFRLEFLNESPAQVTQTISKYRQLLRGEITGPQLWRELKLLNQLGVTRGQIGVEQARG